MSSIRPLLLGHRGLSSRHLENSMEAFRGSGRGHGRLRTGRAAHPRWRLPGVHDEDLARTANGSGLLRQMKAAELPPLKNGEPMPRLADVLELPAKLVNVELKGEPGWQQALATVEAAEALDRVLFSSFEHGEVLQLWAACETARCGFLWETGEAMELSADELADLPEALWLHPPLKAVQARPEFWSPYAHRLAIWGIKTPAEAEGLPFTPAVLIADGI